MNIQKKDFLLEVEKLNNKMLEENKKKYKEHLLKHPNDYNVQKAASEKAKLKQIKKNKPSVVKAKYEKNNVRNGLLKRFKEDLETVPKNIFCQCVFDRYEFREFGRIISDPILIGDETYLNNKKSDIAYMEFLRSKITISQRYLYTSLKSSDVVNAIGYIYCKMNSIPKIEPLVRSHVPTVINAINSIPSSSISEVRRQLDQRAFIQITDSIIANPDTIVTEEEKLDLLSELDMLMENIQIFKNDDCIVPLGDHICEEDNKPEQIMFPVDVPVEKFDSLSDLDILMEKIQIFKNGECVMSVRDQICEEVSKPAKIMFPVDVPVEEKDNDQEDENVIIDHQQMPELICGLNECNSIVVSPVVGSSSSVVRCVQIVLQPYKIVHFERLKESYFLNRYGITLNAPKSKFSQKSNNGYLFQYGQHNGAKYMRVYKYSQESKRTRNKYFRKRDRMWCNGVFLKPVMCEYGSTYAYLRAKFWVKFFQTMEKVKIKLIKYAAMLMEMYNDKDGPLGILRNIYQYHSQFHLLNIESGLWLYGLNEDLLYMTNIDTFGHLIEQWNYNMLQHIIDYAKQCHLLYFRGCEQWPNLKCLLLSHGMGLCTTKCVSHDHLSFMCGIRDSHFASFISPWREGQLVVKNMILYCLKMHKPVEIDFKNIWMIGDCGHAKNKLRIFNGIA
jgi:hypothetical protein